MKLILSISLFILCFINSLAVALVAVIMDINHSNCNTAEGLVSLGLNETLDKIQAELVFLLPSFQPPITPTPSGFRC